MFSKMVHGIERRVCRREAKLAPLVVENVRAGDTTSRTSLDPEVRNNRLVVGDEQFVMDL